jgi:hypothetical protein
MEKCRQHKSNFMNNSRRLTDGSWDFATTERKEKIVSVENVGQQQQREESNVRKREDE